jgi:hypothetical protein
MLVQSYVLLILKIPRHLQNHQVWSQILKCSVVMHLFIRSTRNTMDTRGTPECHTSDLWRRWWEGPSDPSVGEGPGRWNRNASHPRRLGVTRVRPCAMRNSWRRILECSTTPQLEVWARRYGNLSRAPSWDIALEQQWPGSGSQDCQGLNKHNFLNTCPSGPSEESIGIYVKHTWWWSGRMWALEITQGSYVVLKLLGASVGGLVPLL